MMTKTEAVSELVKRGYSARLESGTVNIYAADGKPGLSEIKKILKEIGYHQSFGLIGETSAKPVYSDLLTGEEGQISFVL